MHVHVCITRAEVSNKPKKKTQHKLPKVMKIKKRKEKKENLLYSHFFGGKHCY